MILENELSKATSGWTASTVVRVYYSTRIGLAAYQEEAEMLKAAGYKVSAQSEAGSHIHAGRLIVTGGLSVLAGKGGIRSEGTLTVTYIADDIKRLEAAHRSSGVTFRATYIGGLPDDNPGGSVGGDLLLTPIGIEFLDPRSDGADDLVLPYEEVTAVNDVTDSLNTPNVREVEVLCILDGEEASVGFEVASGDADEFFDAIAAFEWRFSGRRQASGSEQVASSPSPTDVVETIRKLASLRDEGILTAEEFEAKKNDLLKRL